MSRISLTTNKKNITDGLSNTMTIGEKRLDPSRYELGPWYDDIGWTDGWDPDTIRYTGYRPGPDIEQPQTVWYFGYQFGSSHSGGFNAVFADGHEQLISYDIDLASFNALGNREDGMVVDSF